MKTHCSLIVFLLCISFSFAINGQNISVGTKWYYGYDYDSPCEYTYELYETTKDTTINNKKCYFLEKSFHDENGSVSITPEKEILYTEESKVYIFKN
ncbi:MAG: hypothetical protein JXL97_19840, partial [Bacteroidales bacterium]|nr:hypothetical protein [Bacteroidales bacterium]